MSANEIVFEVPLLPQGKGAPRAFVRGKFAKIHTDRKTGQAMGQFLSFALEHAPESPPSMPVQIELDFRFPVPSSWPQWEQDAAFRGGIGHTSKPDVDNCQKLVLDAMTQTGRFWKDDAQIVEVIARKTYAEFPGTRVRVSYLSEWTKEATKQHMAADLFHEKRTEAAP